MCLNVRYIAHIYTYAYDISSQITRILEVSKQFFRLVDYWNPVVTSQLAPVIGNPVQMKVPLQRIIIEIQI